jgi:hypothetical protein
MFGSVPNMGVRGRDKIETFRVRRAYLQKKKKINSVTVGLGNHQILRMICVFQEGISMRIKAQCNIMAAK